MFVQFYSVVINCFPNRLDQLILPLRILTISNCFISLWILSIIRLLNCCQYGGWYVSIVLICISMVINDIEILFHIPTGFLSFLKSTCSFLLCIFFCYSFVYLLLLQTQLYLLQTASPNLWLIFSFFLYGHLINRHPKNDRRNHFTCLGFCFCLIE